MSDIKEYIEYFDNGNIKQKMLYFVSTENGEQIFKNIITKYDINTNMINCEVNEIKSDSTDIYSLIISYYESTNIKSIEWRKNGYYHKDNIHCASRISYYDNEKLHSIAWYNDGSLICIDEGENYANEKWWEFEPYIKMPSSIEYYENGNIFMEIYHNKLFVNIVEYYENGEIKYNIKLNKKIDGFVYNEFWNIGKKINTKTWMFKGDYHNICDYPAYITYHENGSEKVKEWWFLGIKYRYNNNAVYEEYNPTGTIIKKMWNQNYNDISRTPSVETFYEHTGNIRSRTWQVEGINHRDDDLPAVIYYYDVNNVVNNIKYEEWWQHGKLKRRNCLYTKIKYNTNGDIIRAYWLYENNLSQLVNIVIANNIVDILYVYELIYDHETIGSPLYGLLYFIKNKMHNFVYDNYYDEILNCCKIYQNKFDVQNICFTEILYLPPMLNGKFNGGIEFIEIMNDSSKN